MRQSGQDARAIARVLFITDAAAVHHAAVHVLGVFDDLITGATLDVAHEANAAAVLLLHRIVESSPGGQAELELFVQWLHGPSQLLFYAARRSCPSVRRRITFIAGA